MVPVTTAVPPTPTLGGHLLLLWKLRLTLARAAFARIAAFPTLVGALVTIGLTIGAAKATLVIFASPAVHTSPQLALFLALLLGFLASTLWVTWPVVTASVDDAAELSRFALFPIQTQRLFLASVLAGLVEPRTLPVWGALLGAAYGLVTPEQGHFWLAALITILLAMFSVVWGRVGLHLLLNLFRHRRSAEAMGGGLILLLFCSAFVPPPDLSWLRHLSAATPTVDDAFIKGAIATFSLFPTGGWAWTIFSDASHRASAIPLAVGYLFAGVAAGYWLAYDLLLRFHRRAGRSLPQRLDLDRSRAAFAASSIDLVLIEREGRDLLLNSRARLTLALPFFLTILLKLVGARALALELLGPQADGWLIGGVASYGALVLGAGFAQNSFGYDGGGAQLYFGAPVSLFQVIRAKNFVHGGLALLLGVLLVAFYSVYLAAPPKWVIVAALANVAFQAFLFVALGNILSVIAPRKFHPSLKRRDRASPVATALGLAVAIIAITPGARFMRSLQGEPPTIFTFAAFLFLPSLAAIIWRLSIPFAVQLLETRKPQLLKAVARE